MSVLIDPPKTLWYENAKGHRWFPKLPSDQPPEGFTTRCSESMLLCRKLEKHDEDKTVIYPIGEEPEADLVLAMCRPSMTESRIILQRSLLERRRQEPAKLADRLAFSAQVALGRVALPKLYSFASALSIASRACVRCRAALAYTYGLQRGFSHSSPSYAEHKARCEFCEPPVQPPLPSPEVAAVIVRPDSGAHGV